MGYSLIGPGKTSGANYGIHMSGRRNVEIRNGTVREFGSIGIYEDTAGASRKHRVVRVCAISNGGTGIYLSGYGGFIKECTALENGAAGIFTDSSSIVIGNSCIGNGHNGLQTGHSCTIINNNARDNTNSFGIYAYHGCTVIGNTMQGNKSGVNIGQGSTVIANTARGNTEVGIACWSDCLIDQNTAYNNGTANMTASGCTLGVNHTP
jgi:parallel beta-helix repeat protein